MSSKEFSSKKPGREPRALTTEELIETMGVLKDKETTPIASIAGDEIWLMDLVYTIADLSRRMKYHDVMRGLK